MSMNHHIPAGYPYPETSGPLSNELTGFAYTEARIVWRSKLTDADCRSMAADYRMGKKTEENYDAYMEYNLRMATSDAQVRAGRPAKKRGRPRKARE